MLGSRDGQLLCRVETVLCARQHGSRAETVLCALQHGSRFEHRLSVIGSIDHMRIDNSGAGDERTLHEHEHQPLMVRISTNGCQSLDLYLSHSYQHLGSGE